MIRKIYIALFMAVFFAVSGVRADNQEQLIAKVILTVPSIVDDTAQNMIIQKLTTMIKRQFVYLDLSLVFSSAPDRPRPYRVSVNGKPAIGGNGCSYGGLLMGEGVVYELGPIANYNHLLISVATGDRSSFPYHDVSCEYMGSGNQTAFRIRGFFHVLGNSIPTAQALQLRPFTPPFEMARKVLAR